MKNYLRLAAAFAVLVMLGLMSIAPAQAQHFHKYPFWAFSDRHLEPMHCSCR